MNRERDTAARMDELVDWARMGASDLGTTEAVASVDTEKEREPAL